MIFLGKYIRKSGIFHDEKQKQIFRKSDEPDGIKKFIMFCFVSEDQKSRKNAYAAEQKRQNNETFFTYSPKIFLCGKLVVGAAANRERSLRSLRTF